MVLTIDQLTKTYGSITAVDHLSLEVEAGNVYGILGPNGSGKTTTLGMITSITRPDHGTFHWFNQEPAAKARKRIGTLLETPNFYPYMNAEDNLRIVAHIKKVKQPRIDEWLELVNLISRKSSKFRTYSLGMKQRLAIAGALIGNPDVLIFDEPTNGLDPEGIAEMRDLILKIAEQGKTIIMASHILDEVEKICSHVAIIKKGKLLATGQVGAILGGQTLIEVASDNLDQLANLLQQCPFVANLTRNPKMLSLSLEEGHSTAAINTYVFQHGLTLTHLVSKQKSLEQEFLEIVNA